MKNWNWPMSICEYEVRMPVQTWVTHKNSLIFLSLAPPAAINYNYDCIDSDNYIQVKNGILNVHQALLYSHTTGWRHRNPPNKIKMRQVGARTNQLAAFLIWHMLQANRWVITIYIIPVYWVFVIHTDVCIINTAKLA